MKKIVKKVIYYIKLRKYQYIIYYDRNEEEYSYIIMKK